MKLKPGVTYKARYEEAWGDVVLKFKVLKIVSENTATVKMLNTCTAGDGEIWESGSVIDIWADAFETDIYINSMLNK